MTEAEWLASANPTPMLDQIRDHIADRKLRLFAVARSRLIWDDLTATEVRAAVEMSERHADGQVSQHELAIARNAAHGQAHRLWHLWRTKGAPSENAVNRVFFAIFVSHDIQHLRIDPMPLLNSDALLRASAPLLLRDIFGNPFRAVAFDPAWRTDTAVAIARQMYDSREFGAMPILADALQDAGCEDEQVLMHCRDATAAHVRGCCVCDLVLGKV